MGLRLFCYVLAMQQQHCFKLELCSLLCMDGYEWWGWRCCRCFDKEKDEAFEWGMESSVDMSTFGEGSLLRLRDVFVISGTQVRLTNHTQYWRKTFCKHFAGPKKVSHCLKVSKGERTERNNKKLYFLYLNMGQSGTYSSLERWDPIIRDMLCTSMKQKQHSYQLP